MKNPKTKKRHKWAGTEIFSVIVLTIIAILIVVPFWNAVVISLETSAAFSRKPFSWLPGEFTLANYNYLLFQNSGAMITAYKATIGITLIGTFAGMLVSVMGAYAFSRRFPGKKFFFMAMLFTMFFGGGLIPTYLLIKAMGLLDTYTVLVLLGMISTYNIIIMKNGFESTPMDLQEAAMIDGANDLTVFAKIMLPLQKPLIATFSLFTAVGYWNSWYWPMLLLSSGDKTVLQLFLRSIVNALTSQEGTKNMAASGQAFQNTFSQGVKMAAVFAVMLPIMVVYPFLQKYFVKGMLVGAVKM